MRGVGMRDGITGSRDGGDDEDGMGEMMRMYQSSLGLVWGLLFGLMHFVATIRQHEGGLTCL